MRADVTLGAEPLVVDHRGATTTVRLVLSDRGIEDLSPGPEVPRGDADVIVERSAAADAADRRQQWDPESIAAATRLRVGPVRGLPPWGLAASTPVPMPIPEGKVLRLHSKDSPFGGRPLRIDLATAHAALVTRPARGPADLHVRATWDSLCAWLTDPDALFGDVFPDLVDLRGDLGLLSMFEGLLWEAIRSTPRAGRIVRRWGAYWGSPAVRRDLDQLTWPV